MKQEDLVAILSVANEPSKANGKNIIDEIKNLFKLVIKHRKDETELKAIENAYNKWQEDLVAILSVANEPSKAANDPSKANGKNIIDEIKNLFKLVIKHRKDETELKAIENAYNKWKDDGFKIDHPFKYKIDHSGISKSMIHKQTLLHLAAMCGLANVVCALRNEGAKIDVRDGLGFTPLHLAAINGHINIVNALIKAGADIHAQDRNRDTPLHLAAERGHINIVKTLLAAGAKVDALGVYKRTPLHLAAKNGHKEVVEALKNAGADINARDDDGNTPLHLAYFNNHTEVVKYLESQGADVLLKNKKGWVPSDCLNRGIPKLLKEAKEEALKPVKLGVIFGVSISAVIAFLVGMCAYDVIPALGTIGIVALPIAVCIALLPIVIGVGIGFCAYRSNPSTEIEGKNVEQYAPRGEKILI